MAIKGLTGRGAAFPEIGILRKGAPKPNDRQPGKDLDHFRFESDDTAATAKFAAAFGDAPRELAVFVPFRTTDENFEAWREAYTRGKIEHRCDGEVCFGHRTPNGDWSFEPVRCPGECKPVGRLKIVIPALERMAFVTVHTTSVYDIVAIERSLQALELGHGTLQGIPLVLRRVERDVTVPDATGKRVRRKKWLLQIEAASEWAALQFAAMNRAALSGAAREPLQLPPGVDLEGEGDATPAPSASVAPSAAPAPVFTDTITANKIIALWPVYGAPHKETGEILSLSGYLRTTAQVSDLASLPAEKGAKLLAWIEKRRTDAQEEACSNEPQVTLGPGDDGFEPPVADAAPPALTLTQALERAREARITGDQIGAELETMFGVTEMDQLNPEQEAEFAEHLVMWAESL